MLVNGVEIEYREAEGRVRGDQVRVIAFDEPARNDWLAVNQFTVGRQRVGCIAPIEDNVLCISLYGRS